MIAIETVGAFEAKTNFSKLLQKVRNGATIRISHRGVVVAELRPTTEEKREPKPGLFKGQITLANDFDEPLSDFDEYSK